VKVIGYAKFGSPFDVCKCIEVNDSASLQASEVLGADEASAINPADLLVFELNTPAQIYFLPVKE
jgi:NADPH:quinone reductase-like Zn-dependent oxidoreductase